MGSVTDGAHVGGAEGDHEGPAGEVAEGLIGLKHQIADIQGNLLELARYRGLLQRRAKTNHVYLSRTKMGTRKRAKPDDSTTPTTRAS